MNIEVRSLTGGELYAAIDDLARLRIAVFATWPYLYDGNADYEAAYLREFTAAPDAILVAACADGLIVGAATASPMAAQKAELRAPFEARGIDTGDLFYFGESVLLPEWRGAGIGHAFFDHREAQARRCGATTACFAAVMRPDDHSSRPANYVPLDKFWRKRGYTPVPEIVSQLAWKEYGGTAESPKAMQYWMRRL